MKKFIDTSMVLLILWLLLLMTREYALYAVYGIVR